MLILHSVPCTIILSGLSLLTTSAKATETIFSDKYSPKTELLAELPTILPQRPTQTPFLKPLPRHKTFNGSSDSMEQVTSVSELQDITPTAWAYEALRSLVERYGCIAGAEPYMGGLQIPNRPTNFNNDTPFHVEVSYKYPLNDNISITPGVIVLTAPNQDSTNNDAVVIGALRTNFQF